MYDTKNFVPATLGEAQAANAAHVALERALYAENESVAPARLGTDDSYLDKPENWERATCTRIYCGRKRQDGSIVSKDDIQLFTETVVARLFPNGFTRYFVDGGYSLPDGHCEHEPSVIFEIYHEPGYHEAGFGLVNIGRLAEMYRHQFSQASVLVANQESSIAFV